MDDDKTKHVDESHEWQNTLKQEGRDSNNYLLKGETSQLQDNNILISQTTKHGQEHIEENKETDNLVLKRRETIESRILEIEKELTELKRLKDGILLELNQSLGKNPHHPEGFESSDGLESSDGFESREEYESNDELETSDELDSSDEYESGDK